MNNNWMYNTWSMNRVDILGNVWIGDYDAACNFDLMESYAISHIISLYRTPVFPDNYEYLCINIEDCENENISIYFDEKNKFIDNALQNGYGILIHCAGGVSRSATIVIAYMVYKLKISVDDAINELKKYRKSINPNRGFIKQLRGYYLFPI